MKRMLPILSDSERGHSPETFPSCTMRRDVTFHGQDGVRVPESRCSHLSCERAGKTVSPDYCGTCPLRREMPPVDRRPDILITAPDYKQPKILADGTIVYEKISDNPVMAPDVPAGYKRKSNDTSSPDYWAFVPLFLPCLDRKFENHMKPCGCVNVVQVCRSATCPHNGQAVTAEICEACPLRRIRPQAG